MGKRKAVVEESPNNKKTKTKGTAASEKKSKRKVQDDDNDNDEIVSKKTRSGKVTVAPVVEEDIVEPVKPKKTKKEKVIVIEKEQPTSPVKEKKEAPVKRGSKSKNVVAEPKPSSPSPSVVNLTETKSKTTKKVVFEVASITGKEYNEEGEIFQQVEQMWTVFDTVVLISLVVNALILIGSKYSPAYTKYLGVHVQYTTVEDGFMSYIKLVMWSFPTIVSLYTTIVLPFILVEKGVSKVLGFKNSAIVRVHFLLAIIVGSIFYYYDPKLTVLSEFKNLRGLSQKTIKNAEKLIKSIIKN